MFLRVKPKQATEDHETPVRKDRSCNVFTPTQGESRNTDPHGTGCSANKSSTRVLITPSLGSCTSAPSPLTLSPPFPLTPSRSDRIAVSLFFTLITRTGVRSSVYLTLSSGPYTVGRSGRDSSCRTVVQGERLLVQGFRVSYVVERGRHCSSPGRQQGGLGPVESVLDGVCKNLDFPGITSDRGRTGKMSTPTPPGPS